MQTPTQTFPLSRIDINYSPPNEPIPPYFAAPPQLTLLRSLDPPNLNVDVATDEWRVVEEAATRYENAPMTWMDMSPRPLLNTEDETWRMRLPPMMPGEAAGEMQMNRRLDEGSSWMRDSEMTTTAMINPEHSAVPRSVVQQDGCMGMNWPPGHNPSFCGTPGSCHRRRHAEQHIWHSHQGFTPGQAPGSVDRLMTGVEAGPVTPAARAMANPRGRAHIPLSTYQTPIKLMPASVSTASDDLHSADGIYGSQTEAYAPGYRHSLPVQQLVHRAEEQLDPEICDRSRAPLGVPTTVDFNWHRGFHPQARFSYGTPPSQILGQYTSTTPLAKKQEGDTPALRQKAAPPEEFGHQTYSKVWSSNSSPNHMRLTPGFPVSHHIHSEMPDDPSGAANTWDMSLNGAVHLAQTAHGSFNEMTSERSQLRAAQAVASMNASLTTSWLSTPAPTVPMWKFVQDLGKHFAQFDISLAEFHRVAHDYNSGNISAKAFYQSIYRILYWTRSTELLDRFKTFQPVEWNLEDSTDDFHRKIEKEADEESTTMMRKLQKPAAELQTIETRPRNADNGFAELVYAACVAEQAGPKSKDPGAEIDLKRKIVKLPIKVRETCLSQPTDLGDKRKVRETAASISKPGLKRKRQSKQERGSSEMSKAAILTTSASPSNQPAVQESRDMHVPVEQQTSTVPDAPTKASIPAKRKVVMAGDEDEDDVAQARVPLPLLCSLDRRVGSEVNGRD